MSKKNELINTILYNMMNKIDRKQLDELKHCLQVSFYDYTISKIEATEVSCGSEEITEELLKYFAVCKLGAGRSKATVKQYLLAARQLCTFVNNKPLNMITTDDIQYFLAVYKEKHHVSGCTMDSKRRYLSSIFGLLKKHKKINENPMDMVEQIKYRSKIKQPLSDKEIKNINSAINKTKNKVAKARNTAIMQLCLDTGVRVSELTGIDIADVDFYKKEIKVLGKGNKERIVFFSDESKNKLNDYLKLRSDYEDCNPLFMDIQHKRRLKASGVQAIMKKLRKPSGVSRLHPHLIRSTAATDLVKQGIGIDIVAKYLGHSGLDVIQRYVINSQEHIRNEMQKVGLG